MKALKLLVAAAAAVTMTLSAQAAAKRMEVKILSTSSNIATGYWIEYEINGMKFRSDRTGERINADAWNAMSAADKEKTIKILYDFGDRRLQFGDDFARTMGDWIDSRKGWKQGKEILTDRLVDKDFPGLRARFENYAVEDYFERNFLPAGWTSFGGSVWTADGNIKACPDYPELESQVNLAKYYVCELALSAYEALEKAEYLRTAAAVKSTANDLIQLICDKCLVPAISPGLNGGIGLFTAPDAVGTALDYFNSLTGWQDKLQDAVIGDTVSADDALEVIHQMDLAISTSYALIKSCTAKAHELQKAVDARYDEWNSSTNARVQLAEADQLVLKFREYRQVGPGEKVRSSCEATASVAAHFEQLVRERDRLKEEYELARQQHGLASEITEAAEAAWRAAAKAYDNYRAELRVDTQERAQGWQRTFSAKFEELSKEAAALQVAPRYPGRGTAWNDGDLMGSITRGEAELQTVAEACRELTDYADRMEAYHLRVHDLCRKTIAAADELVEAAKPIFNDYLAIKGLSDYAPGSIWSSQESLANWSLERLLGADGYLFSGSKSSTALRIDEADFFYRADPAFMEDVRKARSYAKLCANYANVKATMSRYAAVRDAYRERVTKGVVAAKAAYEKAAVACEAALTGIPNYVTEQQCCGAGYTGYDIAGSFLNVGASTELRRNFVDTTGSIALAGNYRDELNQCVASYTVKLVDQDRAYTVQRYYDGLSQQLGIEPGKSGQSRSLGASAVAVNQSETFQKLRDLQQDFNGIPYAHRVMIGAFAALDRGQANFVTNRNYNASSELARLRSVSQNFSEISSGTGSYACRVPGYYETIRPAMPNVHETLVAPLGAELESIRTLVANGTVDPTWQLKLFKNDGTSVNTNLTCCYGIPRRMPTADDLQWAKPGHVLKGWGSTSNATVVAFAPDALITNATAKSVTKTYYALWALSNEKYTLTCDPMGGAFQTTKYTVVVGKSTYSTLGVPTRRGFKFLGWYNQEEDGVQVFDASGKAVRGNAYWDAKGIWIYEANVTVYARWSLDPNAYLIRFHKCDGTGLTREVGFVYGTSTALPTCAGGLGWKNDSGIFKGWATSIENATKGIVWQKDSAAVSTATAKGKTMDVYAVWETPVISFVAGGGSGFMAPMQMGVNEVRKLTKCAFAPPAGKTAFAGWAGSNGRRYDDEMLVFNLGSVTMTAIWK